MSKIRVWDVTFSNGEALQVFATEPQVAQVAEEIANKAGTSVKTIQQRVLLAYYTECVIRWMVRQPRVVSITKKEGS